MPATRSVVAISPVFPSPIPLLPVLRALMPIFTVGLRRTGLVPIGLRAVANLAGVGMWPVLPARLDIPIVSKLNCRRHDDRCRRRIGRRLVMWIGVRRIWPAVERRSIWIAIWVHPLGTVVVGASCLGSHDCRVACINRAVKVIRDCHAATQKQDWAKKNEKAFHDSTRQNRPR